MTLRWSSTSKVRHVNVQFLNVNSCLFSHNHNTTRGLNDAVLSVGLCVIDAYSRCGLSLAARVTVEPAGHSGACH